MLRGWIALTGTPGVGKTTIARQLRRLGVPVVELGRFAQDFGLLGARDRGRDSRIVDPARVGRALRRVLAPRELAVLEGHWAHDVPGVTAAIVIRLRPRRLEERLKARRWKAAKVRENLEAEAIGVILQEAVHEHGRSRTFEVDATGRSAARVARDVGWVLHHPAEARTKFEVGRLDWAADILEWYSTGTAASRTSSSSPSRGRSARSTPTR